MKIELNEQQLQVLSAALMEIPYRIAAPLISHINQQIQSQKESDDNGDFQHKSV
jgi:hypothetical protein